MTAVVATDVETRTRRSRARRRTLAKWARRVVLVLIAAAVVAGLVEAWRPKPLPVDLATVTRGAMIVTIEEDGRARVKDRYVVAAPLAGSLDRPALRAGDAVQVGTVLAGLVPLASPLLDARTRAELEARSAQAEDARRQADAGIVRAEAALALARAASGRATLLASRGAASRVDEERAALELRALEAEVASARFGARVAAHQVTLARAALGAVGARLGAPPLVLASPVTGRVLRVFHPSGGPVAPGAPLFELGDPAALEVVVDVLSSDAVSVRPGARVELDRWGGPHLLRGRVRLVEPSAFTRLSALGVEEQRVDVVIDLVEPRARWAALGDGYRVEARIVDWESAEVLRVPASAVFRRGAGWAVFRVEEGVARLRLLGIGRRNGLEVEVLRGLAAGDRVVAHPSDRVVDGASVIARAP
jgi:HlyD family secretion protein